MRRSPPGPFHPVRGPLGRVGLQDTVNVALVAVGAVSIAVMELVENGSWPDFGDARPTCLHAVLDRASGRRRRRRTAPDSLNLPT